MRGGKGKNDVVDTISFLSGGKRTQKETGRNSLTTSGKNCSIMKLANDMNDDFVPYGVRPEAVRLLAT